MTTYRYSNNTSIYWQHTATVTTKHYSDNTLLQWQHIATMTMYRYSDNILRDCLHREAKVSSKDCHHHVAKSVVRSISRNLSSLCHHSCVINRVSSIKCHHCVINWVSSLCHQSIEWQFHVAKVSSKVSIECCYSVIIKVSVKQIRCFITADIGFQWHSRVVRGYDQKAVRGYDQKVVRGHGFSK